MEEFKSLPGQKYGSAAALIERCFNDGAISYEELSRPTHGNATWLAITVIQEQKQTAVARIELMRNAMFATQCVVSATNSLANLWGMDLDSVAETVGSKRTDLAVALTWDKVETDIRELSEIIALFDETQFVDAKKETSQTTGSDEAPT